MASIWLSLYKKSARFVLTKGMFRKYAKILQENTHAEPQFHFIKIALQDECSPVKLMDVFQTPFYKNSPRGLLIKCIHKNNIFSFDFILVYS